MKKISAYLLLLSLIIIFISACGSSNDTPTVEPSPPSMVGAQLRADAKDGQVTLYWPMVAGADTYNVYYSASATFTKSTGILFATGLPSAPCTVTSLNNGTTYYFAFTAVSTAEGESDLSEIIPATPQDTPVPPEFPKNVRANAGNGQVTVTWTPVAGAEVYNVYQYSNFNDLTLAAEIKSTGCTDSLCSFTATGLTNGTTYFFYLTAENNTSDKSNVVKATPPNFVDNNFVVSEGPSAPQNVSATAKDKMLTLTWTAPSGATPNTFYNVYYNETEYPFTPTADNKFPERTSPWDFSGLTNGTTYYLYLTAVLASGPSFGAYATPTATPPPMAPVLEPPTLVGSTVTLTWNEVTAIPAVTHYYVYVGIAQGVSKETGDASLVSDLTPPLTTSATLPTGTYYIVVTAVNDYGESAESNEVSVTVP